MQSVLEILNKTSAYFEQKGVPNAKLDAQLLLAHVLGCKRLDLFLRFEEPLEEKTLSEFRGLVRRRAAREPLQHLLGDAEFFGLTLKCDSRALIPRHETEELCEIISARFFTDRSAPLKILDLGTGGGAIALGLANFYGNSRALGADLSADALSLARENAEALGLRGRAEFAQSDWLEKIDGTFDVIVANPPYLTRAEYESAQPEVKDFDPYGALVSADEGLADIRKIIASLPDFLADGGAAFIECGAGQPTKLLPEINSGGQLSAEALADSHGRDRFLVLVRA